MTCTFVERIQWHRHLNQAKTYQKYRDNSSKQLPDEHCEEEDYWDLKLISIPASPHHIDKDPHRQKSEQIHIIFIKIQTRPLKPECSNIWLSLKSDLVTIVKFTTIKNQLCLFQGINCELCKWAKETLIKPYIFITTFY